MLDQIARHGLIDLEIDAKGDLHIDGHHTVEDVGITLGQAVAQGGRRQEGPARYGHAYVPLDEALSRVVIDFSGRPGLDMHVPFKARHDRRLRRAAGATSSSRASPTTRCVTLHIDNLRGDNAHHQCETVFKAFARALRMAVERRSARCGDVIPSTKGSALDRRGAAVSTRIGRRRRLRHGQPALGGAGGAARRAQAGTRRSRSIVTVAARRGAAPPSASCCPARARCPTACASCASPACEEAVLRGRRAPSRCWASASACRCCSTRSEEGPTTRTPGSA